MKSKKLVLIILDGWGYGRHDHSNAIEASKTPFFNECLQKYPNTTLQASGQFVGLPDGQMGNSEVGHMNLGAGRVVYQELGRINRAITDNEFVTNPTIKNAFDYAKANQKNVHFIGLVSDGGVHSHTSHLKALCDSAKAHNIENVFIHAFLDGRDTDPNSGLGYIINLQEFLKNSTGKIASAIGRYYAMDRDNRWERVKMAYDMMVHGNGTATTNVLEAIQQSYQDNITDEFVKPIVNTEDGKPVATIKDGDVVISFNFRTDRGREITLALSQRDFAEQNMHHMNLHYITMTTYDSTYKNVQVIFTKDDLNQTLGQVLQEQGKKQIRIAETEKYPHVTFFFSGGREKIFEGEKRVLIPSPKVATYDLKPEMSANEIKEAIIPELEKGEADFICLNFANPDMVGHTGVYEAVIKAVEAADFNAQQVVNAGIKNGYSFIILADHGNADFMINEDGSANTAHTTNLVPCILIDDEYKHIRDGKLGDIAPTILKILGLNIPGEMTGEVLV